MNAVLTLERMGYRFRVDGEKVTARHYGKPPPEAAALLAGISAEDVLQVLEDRRRGFVDVLPEELHVPPEKASACLDAIGEAMKCGDILSMDVMPDDGGGVVFLLMPPGCFDGGPWEKEIRRE